MRTSTTAALAAALAIWASVATAESPDRTDVVVEIEGLEDDDGVVRCGLYTRSNWLDADEAVQWVDAEYTEGEAATCTFHDMKPGTYGVGAFHDQDADHDMDRNLVGVPVEGVCASNDPKPLLRRPTFGSARFDHDAAATTNVPCTMRY